MDDYGQDESLIEGLTSALFAAVQAALTALLALLLALLTLLARALQAIFILARPAALVGCVVAAGYASVELFTVVLARYGNDLPAALLALSSIVIAPAALLIIADSYGTWALMLAVAGIELAVKAGIERAPPLVLALLPVLALTAVMLYFLRAADHLEEETQEATNEEDEWGRGTALANHRSPDTLHSEPVNPPDPINPAG